MLGRLAKWLRILGYDVIYGRHLSGYGLIRAARADGRLILTRDRSLEQKQPPPFLFIESNDYRRTAAPGAASRRSGAPAQACLAVVWCAIGELQPRSKESVAELVPPYVFATQERFSWCRLLPTAVLAGNAPEKNARGAGKNGRHSIITPFRGAGI